MQDSLFFKIALKIFRRLKARVRPLHLRRRASSAPIFMKPLFEDGICILPWHYVFNKDPEDCRLYLLMKREAEALSTDLSIGPKSKYLSNKYSPGEAITDLGLLSFVHTPEIAFLLFKYFGGNSIMLSADYWKSRYAGECRTGSQNWHTDPEDPLMLKIFVYFADVDESNGATEFIKKTQVGGDCCIRPWHSKRLTGYYLNQELENCKLSHLRDHVISANGREGDIVLINTTDLHRGGFGNRDRCMANYTFVSPHCQFEPRWMKIDSVGSESI